MARILVAEDDEAVRTFVVRALEHRGHTVEQVEDGLEALELLDTGARYDLLITDIVMPGLDGIALALKVARDVPDLPVLLMTGYSAERQRAHNLDELICEVITKPFTLKAICKTAEEVMKGPPASDGLKDER
jgi:CheY-like chemotaxis protein